MRILASGWLLGLLVLGVGAERACVPQERISGRAEITDGDSLEIASARLRLYGVDAPEGRQSCTRDGREWACGNEAARKLRSLVGDRTVTCTRRDVDEYDRIVAVCRSGAVDLAAEMARAGLAVAYRRYSNDYVDEEGEARSARRGMWAGEFARPEEYRRDERAAAPEQRRTESARAEARRDGCYIKGNVNGEGERIYHTPDSPSYRDTAVDAARGERWFCTEAEARAAGWRAPRG
jgi:endonuclease YncB( thermonuclease family)